MGQDSDEEDEDEDMEEGDEFIDVLDILDGKGEPDNDSDTEVSKQPKPPASRDARMDEEDDEASDIQDDEDEDEDDEDADSDADSDTEIQDAFNPSDDEDAVPEALEGLQSFISKLDPTSQKRKAPDTDAAAPEPTERARKRRIITERNEAGVENEFRARAFGLSSLQFFVHTPQYLTILNPPQTRN